MNRIVLLGSVMGACLAASAAQADDLAIGNDSKTAVKTSTAANNSPGNITLNGTISITSGTAITLDSNNSVTNLGGIIHSGASGAVGINMLAGNTGSLSGTGYINMTGEEANNYGVLLNGAGTFSGDILLQNGSSIAVRGANSGGVSVLSPVTGNLTFGGNVSAVGANATGILANSNITGYIAHYGVTGVLGVLTANSTAIDAEGGWALAVGGNVTGGIVNGGPFDSADLVNTTASLSTTGSKPAFYISPSVAGAAAANLTVGVFVDPVNTGFSVINRGSITAAGNDPGVHTRAVRIDGGVAQTATLTGGMFNRGTIRSASTSDNLTASGAAAVSADSTAFSIGARGILPVLNNAGNIQSSTAGPKGGTAIGLSIESGATLPSLINSGTIAAAAIGTDPTYTGTLASYGLRDRSGTLTSINNSGSISGGSSALNNNGQVSVAIDLATTAASVSIVNSGTISGDTIFGTGGGTLEINGANAQVIGGVRTAGGTLNVNLAQGTLQTINTRASTVSVGSTSTVAFVLGRDTVAATPIIATTGATSFASGSKILLTPNSFLSVSGTYTLVSAAGGLTFGNFADTASQQLPFLFSGNYTRDAQNLYVTLNRKTAAQLGLSGNVAAIYEPAALSAATDNELGAALLGLSNAADVQTAMSSLLPDTNGGARALTDLVTSQATGPIAARQRATATSLSGRTGVGFWGQEFFNFTDQENDALGAGYYTSGLGTSLGVEWGSLESGRWGVGYTFYAGHATENNPRQSKTNASLNMFSLYSGWRLNEFFVTPQISAGIGDFSSKRTATIGATSRVLTGNWTGYLASGGVTSGIVIDMGGFYLIPQISLDGTLLRQSGYTEEGGAGANLVLNSQTQKTVRAFVGVAAEASYTFDDGDFRPQILAGYSRTLMKDTPTIDASFEAVPGSTMALVGRPIDDSQIVGGASFSYVMRNWSAGFNYDASSREGALAQSATISLTSRF